MQPIAQLIEDPQNTGQWASGLVELTMPDGKAALKTEMRYATPGSPLVPQPSSEAPLSLVPAHV